MNPRIKLHAWVLNSLGRLAHAAICQPRRTLVIAAAVTLAAAPGMLRLTLRTDGHALVAPDAPEVRYDKFIREKFGVEDQIVVLVSTPHPDGIFNPATLQLVRDLTADFLQMPGINPSNVMSLATEPSFRLRPNSLFHQTMLEPPLQTRGELDQLREDLRRIQLYTGTAMARDEKSTCILIGTPAGSDRTQLYQRVRNIVAPRQTANETISVTGAPVAESLLGRHILEDLGIPKALLGASTRSHQEKVEWKTPSSFYELRQLIARRIGLVPVAVLVMLLVFFVAFRKPVATLLPLPEIAATLVFVFGLMGWLGVPIYLTIAVMPVLLTAMCVTDEIHIFSRYFSLLHEKQDTPHQELVRETMNEMVSPVANTTLTTAIGFISFAFSPLKPVQAFGIFTALGVLFSLLYSLTVIPAMLTLLNPAWLVSRRVRSVGNPGGLGTWFARLAQGIVRHRWWALGLLVIVTALTPLGLRRLVVQDSWIDGFDPDSEFHRATELVNEQFHGMHLLLVSVELPQTLRGELPPSAVTADGVVIPSGLLEHPTLIAGSPITISTSGLTGNSTSAPTVLKSHIEMVYGLGKHIGTRIPRRDLPANFQRDFSRAGKIEFDVVVHSQIRPEVVHQIRDLAAFIRERSQYAVGGVLSPYDYLETTRFMARPNDPNSRRLPDDAAEIKLMWDYYGLARGQQRLHQIVDRNYWQSLTTVFLKDANFQDTARLMADLRAYEFERLAPQGIKLGFAGDVAVSQSLIRGIVTTQVQSLFWSLVGIYLVTSLFGGSLRSGILCVLPTALAVLVNFAVMGWFGIPLGVATSMFAGMTLGIGVDFAIHLLAGFRLARADGASPADALSRTMMLTGPAVVINTLAISFGFGVLILSQVPANARLGLLTVLGLVNCLMASLLIFPLLSHWSKGLWEAKSK